MNITDWQRKLDDNENEFIMVPFYWNQETPESLVTSYIDFLLKENRREKYYRSYFEAIRKYYLINPLKPSTRKRITLEWLNICYRTDDKNVNFYFATHPDGTIDREEQIETILFPNKKQDLDDFFKTSREGRAYLRPLLEWFLNTYNLPIAKKILLQIWRPNKFFDILLNILFPISPNIWSSYIFPFIIVLLALSLALPFFYIPNFHPDMLSLLPFYDNPNFQKLQENNVNIVDSPAAFILAIFYFISVLLIGSYIIYNWRLAKTKPGKNTYNFPGLTFGNAYQWPRLWVPRLIGGIMVGYFPLIVSQDVWRLALTLDSAQIWLIIILSLFLSWFYLRTTVAESSYSHNKITQKARYIFGIGMFQSFLMGVFISDVMALPILNIIMSNSAKQSIESITVVWGILGILVPKIIFLFSPLALLIGIFVQLLWEDKPITQSL